MLRACKHFFFYWSTVSELNLIILDIGGMQMCETIFKEENFG